MEVIDKKDLWTVFLVCFSFVIDYTNPLEGFGTASITGVGKFGKGIFIAAEGTSIFFLSI